MRQKILDLTEALEMVERAKHKGKGLFSPMVALISSMLDMWNICRRPEKWGICWLWA